LTRFTNKFLWFLVTGLVGAFATETQAGPGAGYALQFEGVDQSVGILQWLRFDNEFTFEAWVKLTNYGTYTLISGDDPNGTALPYDFVFQIGPTGRFALYAANAWDAGSSAVPLNEWAHVAATYDGTAKRFYINGELDRSVPSQNLFGGPAISFTTYIGRQAMGCVCNWFKGRLDEVRVWTKRRTDEEILTYYRRRLTGLEFGLAAYYRFDEGTGNVTADSSTNNLATQIFSAAEWVISDVPLEILPAAATLPANSVTHNSALIIGVAAPDGVTTGAWFEWGLTTNYGNRTAAVELGSNSGPTRVTQALSDLDVNVKYHYRLLVTNATGLSIGLDSSFLTPLFETRDVAPDLGGEYGSLAWGDYNSDGRLDFAVCGYTPGLDSTIRSDLFANTGSGFTNSAILAPSVFLGSVAWGDYNNDNRPDLLITGYGYEGSATELWRNRGLDLEITDLGLPGVVAGCVAWGDFDNDGLVDILLTGKQQTGPFTGIFRNTGKGFTNTGLVLPGTLGFYRSSAEWGDYDNDGRLDFLLSPVFDSASNLVCQVWRNTGNGFTNTFNLPISNTEATAVWGDYDNDGWLDILHTSGITETTNGTVIFRNTGNGFKQINLHLPADGAAAWGDYDNDGQLDILLTGPNMLLYRMNGDSYEIVRAASGIYGGAWGDSDNDGRLDILSTGGPAVLLSQNFTPQTNSLPSAPSGLVEEDHANCAVFRWNPATDAQTPGSGLSYNLRVGTTPGGCDIVSPMANLASGRRFVAARGPVQSTRWFLKGLVPGQRYFWSVQAIDTSFAAGAWAGEMSFMYDPVRLAPPLRLLNGSVQLTFTNLSGGNCRIFGSVNLIDWLDLGAAAPVWGTMWGFTDTAGPQFPQRFYRLQRP